MKILLDFIPYIFSLPVCIVVIAVMFRKPIIDLLKRISRIDLNNLGVTVDLLNKIDNDMSKLKDSPPISVSQSKLDVETAKIAETNPFFAVNLIYMKLENTIRVKALGINPNAKNFSFKNTCKLLLQHKVIEQKMYEIIAEMKKFSNDVAYKNMDINEDTAKQYGEIAESLINILLSKGE